MIDELGVTHFAHSLKSGPTPVTREQLITLS